MSLKRKKRKENNIENISADFKLIFAVLFHYLMLIFSTIPFSWKEKLKNVNFLVPILSTVPCLIVIDLKTILVAIAPHTQGIFCQSDKSARLFPLTFCGEGRVYCQMWF